MGSVTSENSDIGKPQEAINEFWDNLITKKPTKVTKVFPSSLYKHLLPPARKPGTVKGRNAAESYAAAAEECKARVERVVRECHRINERFTDADFDIEDLRDKNCLLGVENWLKDPSDSSTSNVSASALGSAFSTLIQSDVMLQNAISIDLKTAANVLNPPDNDSSDGPGSVHRIGWIFDKPQFEIDGFSSSDLCQGYNGDCWFIAAVATICSNPKLIEKVCVARDEECGVYGFVFHRDGEWIWTVVDDNLYLKYADFDEYGDRYDPSGIKERRYKQNNQTGSEALYFASCADPNETWLPLMEKAYAKVHGDYDAIAGGWSGEAVEDLTGGVTNKVLTDRVLSRERLWKELLLANEQFLFSASSPSSYGDDSDARRGLALGHAYSVIKAVDVEGPDGKNNRLVLIRNPWGRRANAAMGEWTGPWGDGSKEWTPYWMKKLDHTFGDDGLFWMSYDDLLKRFDLLDRTRLFNEDWTVVQQWTSVSVAWVTGYLNTKFSVEIKKAGPTVFVLCQLDERYFKGLEGKYDFDLHFILQKQGAEAGDHIVRARGAWFGNRSISAEVDLEVGTYEVLPKIEAERDNDRRDVHEVVTKLAESNPQKLRQIGLNYDIANAKGITELSEEEQKKKDQKKKEAAEKKKKEKEAEEKEKAEFEKWKKEEKAEYEAWKKAKQEREEKEKPKEEKKEEKDEEKKDTEAKPEVASTETKTDGPTEGESKDGETKEVEPKKDEETKPTVDLPVRVKEPEAKEGSTPEPAKPTEPKVEVEAASDDDGDSEHDTPDEADDKPVPPESPKSTRSVRHARGPPSVVSHVDRYPGSVYGDELPLPPPPPPPPMPEDNTPKTWNAVCVLGLRVYSKDPEVSIKLVKPKDVEEGAILDVDGETPAGATM